MACPGLPLSDRSTAPLGCGTYVVEIWDHDEKNKLYTFQGSAGQANPYNQIKWDRRRNDISQAEMIVATDLCCDIIGKLRVIKHLMVIRRQKEGETKLVRVWVGIITRIEYTRLTTTVVANDMLWGAYRTVLMEGYNNGIDKHSPTLQSETSGGRMFHDLTSHWADRDSNTVSASNRVPDWWAMKRNIFWNTRNERISLNLPISAAVNTDKCQPKNCGSIPYGTTTVWEDVDSIAEDHGMDYTVIVKQIHIWDKNHRWCVVPGTEPPGGKVSLSWIAGVPDTVEYGSQYANRVVRSNGTGYYGDSAGKPPFAGGGPYGSGTAYSDFQEYGPIEYLDSVAEDDNAVDPNAVPPCPAVRFKDSLADSATRTLANKRGWSADGTHLSVRMPSGTQILPSAPFGINDLVAGAWVWYETTVTNPGVGTKVICRSWKEWQKIDTVEVIENQEDGEIITFSTESATCGRDPFTTLGRNPSDPKCGDPSAGCMEPTANCTPPSNVNCP